MCCDLFCNLRYAYVCRIILICKCSAVRVVQTVENTSILVSFQDIKKQNLERIYTINYK